MLAQRSLPQLLPPMIAAGRQQLQQQQIANKTKLITRNIALSRQNSQLLQQFERQNKRFLSSFSFSTWSAIKSTFHKNFPKGSPTSTAWHVCLVLLPVTTVSCTASLNLSTTTTAATGSKSFEESDSKMSSEELKNAKTIYEFTVKDTHGNDVSLEKYKGHVVLIVNIASQCGLTKNNYKKLTDLLEKYQDKGLRILNFPCNQFGSQMPEQDGEAMVCHLRDAKAEIGDVFQKVDVNGSNAAPIYQFLKAKQGGTLGSAIKWNFTKFLVNKEGVPVNRYAPTTDPMDIAKDIEKLL